MAHQARTSPRRGFAPRASIVASVLGVLSYLFLPGLHAFHAVTLPCHPTPGASHVHHGHDHGPHEHVHAEEDDPAEPCHDPASCDVCRVYFATHSATALPAPVVVCLPDAGRPERPGVGAQRVVVSEVCPARPLRGPPC